MAIIQHTSLQTRKHSTHFSHHFLKKYFAHDTMSSQKYDGQQLQQESIRIIFIVQTIVKHNLFLYEQDEIDNDNGNEIEVIITSPINTTIKGMKMNME